MTETWGKCNVQVEYNTLTGHWKIHVPDAYDHTDKLAWYVLTVLGNIVVPAVTAHTDTHSMECEIEWETLLSLDRPSR